MALHPTDEEDSESKVLKEIMMTTPRKHITIKRVIAYAAIALIFIEYAKISNSIEDFREIIQMISDFFKKNNGVYYNTFINASLLILIIIAAIADVAIFINKKYHQDEKEIKRLDGKIVDLRDEITNNKASNEQYIEEITNKWEALIAQKQKTILKQKADLTNVSTKQKKYAKDIEDMNNGVLFLYYIMNEEDNLNLNKQETEKLLKCLKNIDSGFMDKLEHISPKALTPKEELFCMLWRLGKTKDSIMQILGLSKDAYRQIKFRTLKKLKEDSSLKLFCDRIE